MTRSDSAVLLEIVCPMCGGIVEATDTEELMAMADEHCLASHGYHLPREHALAAVRPVE
jgi:predicted small metal-binding protein